MKNIILLVAIFGFTVALNAQEKTKQNTKFQKLYESNKALVNSQHYTFVANWVFSDKKREKISVESNNLIVNKLEVAGVLTELSSEQKALDFNDTMRNYSVDFNDNEQRISIAFKANNNEVNIEIKPNGNVLFFVNSGDGKTISYRGYIK